MIVGASLPTTCSKWTVGAMSYEVHGTGLRTISFEILTIGRLLPTRSICFKISYCRMKSIIPTTSSCLSSESSTPTRIE
jgi:hypothetical protein